MAVASAGPYASLHLAPDRQPHKHPTAQFFTGRMPFLPPNQQRQSTEGIKAQRHYTTHTHPFNGPLSRTSRVSRYQKGKTNLDFTEARDIEWQWHQLGHMQVCTSLQTDNHATPHNSVFYRPDALPAAQPTVSKRHYTSSSKMIYQTISVHYYKPTCRQ